MTRTFPYAELHSFPDGDKPHTGNPAGVMLLEEGELDDADLQGIARSNNLSETAFLMPIEDDLWHLRWFTPGQEVDLCGHATLAAAVWLFRNDHVSGEEARFNTRSGRLSVRRDGHEFEMNFPEVGFEPGKRLDAVIAAMGGAEPSHIFEVERIHGARYQMLVYASEGDIASLRPDTGALAATGVNVVATAEGRDVHFVSRFFCPAAGLKDEDPVTGSAHCTLAPYWSKRLGFDAMTARQIGPRPGALKVRTGADGRVRLIGTAKDYLAGTITL